MNAAERSEGVENNSFARKIYFNGEEISLRAKEKALLEILIKMSPICVTRQSIGDKVWNGRFVSDYTINQTINSLRKSINDNERLLIKTKPREGYVIDKEVAALFIYDNELSTEALSVENDISGSRTLSVLASEGVKHIAEKDHEREKRVRRKATRRIFILMSLLVACGMAGVGVSAIRNVTTSETLSLYLDGVKFTFRQGSVEYFINNKIIKCKLLKRTLSDGEIITTTTTQCEATT